MVAGDAVNRQEAVTVGKGGQHWLELATTAGEGGAMGVGGRRRR